MVERKTQTDERNMATRVSICAARKEDAPFIAKTVLAAMGLGTMGPDAEEDPALVAICKMEDTLYSYRNSLIAKVEGKNAGCLVAYPGDIYEESRKKTFALIGKIRGKELEAGTEMETFPGEYYLDSVAVEPEFRGYRLAERLMEEGFARAKESGSGRIGLIADNHRDWLRRYYEGMGFRESEHMLFFGEEYVRMYREL